MNEPYPEQDPQRPPGMKGGTGVPPTETPPGEGFLSGTGPQETYNPTRGWAKGPLFVIGIMVVGMVVLFIIWAAIV
ncbi:membrane protein [Streptomyces sp. NRRL B-1568]|nr:membrane protein [Streptomyces sp. NRRL B-1568]